MWATACFAFVGIVMMMTKFFMVDPNLSGGPETGYLIPMLSIIAVGALSFGTAGLTWIISLFKKVKLIWKHFLISFIAVFIIASASMAFVFGISRNNLQYQEQSYTGQELFEEVNRYRVANGVTPLTLDMRLCDNLVSRYIKVHTQENEGHAGLEEWIKTEGIDKLYLPILELYTKNTFTTKEAVEFWATSPGHRLGLVLDEVSKGCAYADKGTGVLILGEPIKK